MLVPLLLLLVMGTSFLFLANFHLVAADDNNGDNDNNGSSTSTNDANNHDNDNGDSHDDAGSTNEGEHHDDEAMHEEREVKVSKSGQEVEIESELKNGTNKDKVELQIKAHEDVEVKLKYKTESSTAEYKVEFRVEFREIIEYLDNDTTGSGYQPGVDTIVSRYRIGDHLGNDINYTIQTINNAQVHIFEITTTDGVFTVTFKLPEAVLNVSKGVVLTPNALKIDVEINNFPYQGSDTSLSLLTKVKTKTKYEMKDHTEHEDLGISANESELALPAPDNSTAGFFSWAETASADGQTISVVNTRPLPDTGDDGDEDHEAGEESRVIYFSFIAVQPKNIYWDPKVGVLTAHYLVSLLENVDAGGIFGFEFIAVLAAFGFVSVTVLQRKYRRK